MKKIAALILAFAACFSPAVAADPPVSYSVDLQKSKIEIQVGREGFLKTFGHDHLISATQFSGEVRLAQPNVAESSVSLSVDAKSLSVLDPSEPEKDRNEVQKTMLGEQVLDVARFPQIEFVSSSVKSLPKKGDTFQLQVEGTLSLHGVKKPATVAVRVQVTEDGTLTAFSEITLLQTDYGITPIKVGGGTVRVKDNLKLTFQIVAHKNPA